jgi:membrane-bound metal-dependent hydrolase YbcI (DUF457 family)
VACQLDSQEPIMIAGHFGFAAAVKSKAPSTPLWLLMLASQWLDVVFVPLFVAGIERLQPVAGAKAGAYGQAIIHADYTHSFVGALLLSLVFGGLAALRYGRKSGGVLALVALSHWVLDLFMHRADMPILPGDVGEWPRLGFGLWRYSGVSAALELALVMLGAAVYWRAAVDVSGAEVTSVRRANLCGASVLCAGVLTLGLNLLGL